MSDEESEQKTALYKLEPASPERMPSSPQLIYTPRRSVDDRTHVISPRSVFPRVRSQASPVVSKAAFFYPWDIPSIYVSYNRGVSVPDAENQHTVHGVYLHSLLRILNAQQQSIVKDDFHICGCVQAERMDSDSFRKLTSVCASVSHTHSVTLVPNALPLLLQVLKLHPAFHSSLAVALQSLRTSRAHGTDFFLSNPAAIVISSVAASAFGGEWRVCHFHELNDGQNDAPLSALPHAARSGVTVAATVSQFWKEECVADCLMMQLTIRAQTPSCPVICLLSDCPLLLQSSVWLFLTVRLLQPVQRNQQGEIFESDSKTLRLLAARTDTAMQRLIALFTDGSQHVLDTLADNDGEDDSGSKTVLPTLNQPITSGRERASFCSTEQSPLHDGPIQSPVTPSTIFRRGEFDRAKLCLVEGAISHQFSLCNDLQHHAAASYTCVFDLKQSSADWIDVFPCTGSPREVLAQAIQEFQKSQAQAGTLGQNRSMAFQTCFDGVMVLLLGDTSAVNDELLLRSATGIRVAARLLSVVQTRIALLNQGFTSASMAIDHHNECDCAQRGRLFLQVSLRSVREDVQKTLCAMYVNVEDSQRRYVWHRTYSHLRNSAQVIKLQTSMQEVSSDVSDAVQYFIRGDLGLLPVLRPDEDDEDHYYDDDDNEHDDNKENNNNNAQNESNETEYPSFMDEEIVMSSTLSEDEAMPAFLHSLREELLAQIESPQYIQLLQCIFASFSTLLASTVPHEDVNATAHICYCGIRSSISDDTNILCCGKCGFVFTSNTSNILESTEEEEMILNVQSDLDQSSFVRFDFETNVPVRIEEDDEALLLDDTGNQTESFDAGDDGTADAEDSSDARVTLARGFRWFKQYGQAVGGKLAFVLKRTEHQYTDHSTELTDLAK